MSDRPGPDHDAVFHRIAEILLDQPPHVHGALLADLLATWLAAHRSADVNMTTDEVRDEMLRRHMRTVRRLLPLIAAQIDAKRRAH